MVSRERVYEAVVEGVCDVYGVKPHEVNEGTRFDDFGPDSMEFAELAVALEGILNCKGMIEADIQYQETVGDLTDWVWRVLRDGDG